MKKFAIGCGIIALVLIVVVIAGGMLVWNRYVKPMAGAVTQFSQIGELEKQVRSTASFAAPENGVLTDEMLARFMRVQEAMETRLGPRVTQLRAKYDQIERNMRSEDRRASFGETMDALKDLGTIVLDAKRAQVDALNSENFSVREYEWVREQAYAAVGIVASGFDLKELQEYAQQAGRTEREEPEAVGEVPARNKELVAPFKEKLERWAPFAYFGL